MKSKLTVLMFMVLMVSTVQARELTRNASPVNTQNMEYPEPRGVR